MDHKIVHTLPFLIRGQTLQQDLHMADFCLGTLCASGESMLVIYNQGVLSNQEVSEFVSRYTTSAVVIGGGINVGIPKSRQSCFEYIWEHYPETQYISEIHLDMAFGRNWYVPLIEYLERTDEPMVSPGIITASRELHPEHEHLTEVRIENTPEFSDVLSGLERDVVLEGFVHPVVHRADVLRKIGGYDCAFLTGKQGYEDDSLLLGYLYYMGTRTNWRPKCYLQSRVYHATMAQRMTMDNINHDFQANLSGLARQYGAYGFQNLAAIHGNNDVFLGYFMQMRNSGAN